MHRKLNGSGEQTVDPAGEADELQQRLEALLQKIEPYWDDLLRRGCIAKKFPDRPDSPWVLQFRQKLTGTKDGRQKRIYVGSEPLARRLADEIYRRRRKAWVGIVPPHYPMPRREVVLTGLDAIRRRAEFEQFRRLFSVDAMFAAVQSMVTGPTHG